MLQSTPPADGTAPLFPFARFLEETVAGCHPAELRVTVVDAGAMDTGERPVFEHLHRQGLAHVVGFEPLKEECARLNDQAAPGDGGASQRFLPVALGSGQRGELRRCSQPMTSSMLEPNSALLSQFRLLGEVTTVVERLPMATKRLDDLLGGLPAGRVDFLKLDVQGYELEVLRGAEEALKGTLVVHTEVEFLPMYVGQPLFADIDAHLRSQGFVFHRFFGIKGAPSRAMALPLPEPPHSQLLWADAVYVRSLWSEPLLRELAVAQLMRMALILHEVYMSYDAAHHVLSVADARAAARYRDLVLGRVHLHAAFSSCPTAASSAPSGHRYDPSDGRSYSFDEFEAQFCSQYSEDELRRYWIRAMTRTQDVQQDVQQDHYGGAVISGGEDAAPGSQTPRGLTDWAVVD